MFLWGTVVFAISVALFVVHTECRPAENSTILSNASGSFDMEMAKLIWMLSRKVWDLNQCPPGIQIKIGRRRLNKKRFHCNKNIAMKLAPMLLGDRLDDRMYVWCRMAAMYAGAEDSGKSSMKTFDVGQLQYLEGDIVLTRDDVDEVLAPYFPTPKLRESSLQKALAYQKQKPKRRQKRKSIRGLKWPNEEVRYTFNETTFIESHQEAVLRAISLWEQHTCIRFKRVPLNTQGSRIEFQYRNDTNCLSSVGRLLNRANIIRLGNGCEHVGIVLHEIGHSLGFYHEHTRSDRDQHITIDWKKIKPDLKNQFRKRFTYNLGVPYDYSSVMHYGATDFGEGNIVIRTKDPEMQKVIGQRVFASFMDVKLMNINYCSKVCGTTDLNWEGCQNGGYRNPNDCESCVCPRGLAPPFCEEPEDEVNADCGTRNILATQEERILTSPGFDRGIGMNRNAFCPWIIRASSPQKRVRLEFKGRFHVSRHPHLPVCEENLEVRYKNISRAGPRYCQSTAPTKIFRSHGPEILLSLSTLNFTDSWQGFQAVYAEENCGGCSQDASEEEPACFRTVEFKCPPSLPKFLIANRSPKFRTFLQTVADPCFRDEAYCCDGFKRVRDRCFRSNDVTDSPPTKSSPVQQRTSTSPSEEVTSTTDQVSTETTRATSTSTTTESTGASTDSTIVTTRMAATSAKSTSPTTTESTSPKTESTTTTSRRTRTGPPELWWPWSAWSPCSADCGLCGVRRRARVCVSNCLGPSEEISLCAAKPCKKKTESVRYLCQKTQPQCLRKALASGQPSQICEIDSVCTVTKETPECCHGDNLFGECRILL